MGDLAAVAIGLSWGVVAGYAEVLPGGIAVGEAVGLVAAVPAYAALPLRRRWAVPSLLSDTRDLAQGPAASR